MSLLKKFGTVVLKIVDVLTNFNLLPLLKPAGVASGVVDRLVSAFHAITTAEQMFAAAYGAEGGKGSDKLKAATPFVAALVGDAMKELKPGARPKDEAKFEDAVTRATAALADAMNSYGD